MLISILLLTGTPHAKSHDLNLNLKVGDTYAQNFQSSVAIKQTVMGIEQEILTDIFYRMDFEVTAFTDDLYQMTVQYRKMEMKMTTAMGEVEMSSEGVEDPSDVSQSLMSHLVNKPFYVQMSRGGRIGQVKGLEEVITSVFDNYPDASDMQKAQLRTQLEQGYGEESFRGNMELITAVLPDQAVEIGESWSQRLEVKTTMPLISESTFTLDEVGPGSIWIDGTGTMKTSDQTTDINGMEAKYVTSGQTSSRIELDAMTHWISSAEISQSMSGDVEIMPSPNLPEGLKFPMEMEVKTKITN